MITMAERKAATLSIAKRYATYLLRGQPGNTAYGKLEKEKLRHVVVDIEAHHMAGEQDKGN